MNVKLIYPKWRKLERQTEFHLPPHSPVVFAASLPAGVEVQFIDENVDLAVQDRGHIVGGDSGAVIGHTGLGKIVRADLF